MCIEDIAWMKAIPGMVVLNPCDYNQTRLMVKKMYEYDGYAYMRTSREPVVCVTSMEDDIEIGKAQVLREGKDLTIAATGIMTTYAYEVAEKLAEEGIECTILNYHTIKPFDEETLVKYVNQTGNLLTVEEHNIIGGLGSAVAEVLAETVPTKMARVGIEDVFGTSASAEVLLDYYKLNAAGIVEKTLKLLGK